MARGILRWNPRNKLSVHKKSARINAAIIAKTDWLSEEFKALINEISGQDKANEKPMGWDETRHEERTHTGRAQAGLKGYNLEPS